MTEIQFAMEGSRVLGFTVSGHSGFSEEGQDIVCAAITSAVRMIACAVNDVLSLGAAVKVSEETATISLKLPGGLDESAAEVCQTMLVAMMLHMVALSEEYPENIIVLEV